MNYQHIIISKICKQDRFELHDSSKVSFTKLEPFVLILLIVNLFLNQTLLTILLYVRKIWMTQQILVISP